MTRAIVTNLWLIPAVPLAASLIILSLANSRCRAGAALTIIGQVVALALSILAFSLTLQTPGFRVVHNFTWFMFGENALRNNGSHTARSNEPQNYCDHVD